MRNLYQFFINLLALTFILSSVSFTQDVSAWAYRVPITVSNPSGVVQWNFQVKIELTSAQSGVFSAAQSDGSDVRVTSGDQLTFIPFWIENWNQNGEQATVWVKIPKLDASGTTIYLYYDNPAEPDNTTCSL